jgi:hypothetical protein
VPFQIPECVSLPHGQGLIIPCLIENFMNVTTPTCQSFLNKMATIIFSDYRFIYKFAETCKGDIENTQCGRLEKDEVSGTAWIMSIFWFHSTV